MKVSRILLGVVFAAAVLAVMPLGARQPASAAGQAEKKETKWQGHVVRIYKDTSMMDLRGGENGRDEDMHKVAYEATTEWTNGGKPGKMEEVKEGSFVIILGHVDDKGVLHATRVDLRKPR
jgi:hypothetical protein